MLEILMYTYIPNNLLLPKLRAALRDASTRAVIYQHDALADYRAREEAHAIANGKTYTVEDFYRVWFSPNVEWIPELKIAFKAIEGDEAFWASLSPRG